MFKQNWEKLQEFANENKDLLVMFACPQEDAILVSFAGLNGFVKFPKPESFDKGVVINALRESKFDEAVGPLIAGVVEATGISVENKGGNELLKVLGGAIKSIGIEKAKIGRKSLEEFNKKQNAKEQRKSKSRSR